MIDQQPIVERLSQFNNMSFTKKQWEIILKGCGCPKSSHFWTALRNLCMWRNAKLYYLADVDSKAFENVWNAYCEANKTYVMKSYNKAKARAKAREKAESLKCFTLYMVNGTLTTEKPEKE